MNSNFLGTGLKQKLPKKAKVIQKRTKVKMSRMWFIFFSWQTSYTEISLWLTLNIEGFIGLSSWSHSSTYENHMGKGKYEVGVSFTEHQNNALVAIPNESIMKYFLTIFWFSTVLLIFSLKFAPDFSAICSLPKELSPHSFLDWLYCCPCHNVHLSQRSPLLW